MKKLRVALAQINTTVGDLSGNRKKIISYIKQATKMKADIILFPELSTTGYPPEDLLLNPSFVEENLFSIKELAKSVEDSLVIVGFVNREKEDIYNAAALIHRGRIVHKYHKMRLPNYSVFDEVRYFKGGDESHIAEHEKVSYGVNICEDIWHPKGPFIEQSAQGAKIVFNISASPFYTGKPEERRELLIKRAVENNIYIALVNLVGGQDELVFDGNSLVIDNKGQIIAQGASFDEDLLTIDLELTSDFNISGYSTVNRKAVRKCEGIEEIYHALVIGTRDYVHKNGFKKVILGLSGGIDSSVTAAIAVAALGDKSVVGVTMPSVYSSSETKTDAQILAGNLNIELKSIPIQNIFETYLKMLEPAFKSLEADVTEENLQARIRGNILMALSNKFGWLVLTTGNKSELSMGYSTLYGDMAGGFAVIKDVSKTVVYQLAEYINKSAGRQIIPESAIKRPPSAELRFNQKDSDTLPPYDLLDPVLKMYVEEDKSFKEMAELGFDPELIKRVVNTVDRNEYKRRQSPPGIKITRRAFGKDRRFPITNRYTYPDC
jgi:NAD+ synthase (glutamine-hydrolysing)